MFPADHSCRAISRDPSIIRRSLGKSSRTEATRAFCPFSQIAGGARRTFIHAPKRRDRSLFGDTHGARSRGSQAQAFPERTDRDARRPLQERSRLSLAFL